MKFKAMILVFLVTQFGGCTNPKADYEQIASYQDHSVPELEIEASDSSRVLIIMPHADDETVAGGLIALLREKGATIHLLTLCEHDTVRVEELHCSASKLGIEKVEIAGFVNNTWDDIMEEHVIFWYDHQDSIKQVIANKINLFNPEILITYDSEIGGYGHPEHRISAKLTEAIFYENRDHPAFSPEIIFQITLTEKLEEFLVANTPGYDLSIELTGSMGLPDPDVSVDIRKYWKIKNEAAQCHQSQIRILRRFFIVYDERFEAEHILAFGKEYYRTVEK
ncbi:MAG: PIG-L deacetylase family protein [Bacteroides sp.]|nr:PIG-L deacetylase family protein [Bacteroides sp.]